jgi:hypothetical protein
MPLYVCNDAQLLVTYPGTMNAIQIPPVGPVDVIQDNLIPSQNNPPPVFNANGSDWNTPTGWTFSSGAKRIRSGTNAFGNLISPSNVPFYNLLQGTGTFMRTNLQNLVIGKMYKLSGYVSNRPGSPVSMFEMKLDAVVIIPPTDPSATKFVPLGPVMVQATATSHTLEFRNVSDPGDCSVMVDGLLFYPIEP